MNGKTSPRWTFRHEKPDAAQKLKKEAHLPELAARILANRGADDPAQANRFLDAPLRDIHDPFEMADMDRAAARVAQAITRNEPIAIYGDYDVDGVCAIGVLLGMFRFLGVEASYYIPHRVHEGYGLNRMALDKLAARGARLLITVDNGITANEEVAYARSLGMDVVVTDHHEPGLTLPEACAVVDPKRADRPYPHADLCGAGVAWKLAHAVLREMGASTERGRAFLKSQLDIVALATVADMVPIMGENRALARAGIEAIRANPRAGLRALLEVANCNLAISARDLSFVLAPRINAMGRVKDAMVAVRLIVTEDREEARALAQEMNTLNTQRREEEKEMFEEAVAEIEKQGSPDAMRVLVVAREQWHVGYVGLIASRLCEAFYRPAFVISIDAARNYAKGSARSIPNFHLYEALHSFFGDTGGFGGHAMAAGFHLTPDKVAEFHSAMTAYSERHLTPELLRPEILIDAEAPLSSLTLEAVEAIARFEPFGEGNPQPIVSFSGVSLADVPRVVGRNHLRLRVSQNGASICAIGWGMGGLDPQLLKHQGLLSVAGHPVVNDYNGRRTAEIEMCDVRLE
ncbi:MAG: single-stranded-DNA-specific exonuclease RecJ [Candidatus Sumerlaeota bacterium]|nr:single-stranded-DNA-specific exonuclease RecJ [Candidatus Sumerlaeota bacterium]